MICYIKVDGGSPSNRYTYYIDAHNKAISADKFILSIEALNPDIKPIIKCNASNLTENGACSMRITSLYSLTIQSIDFEGAENSENGILQDVLNLQNSGTIGYQLTLINSSFTNLNIQVASSWSTVTNCTFIQSNFDADTQHK